MNGWDGSECEDETIRGINVTPLVDTALVLLLVFMVATPILMNQAVRVKLPKVAHSKPAMITTISLTMTKEGKLYLNGVETDYQRLRDQLRSQVAQITRTEGPDGQTGKLQAIIAADSEVPHGDVMHLVDVVKDMGIEEFAFNIEKVEKVPPP